ncbi:MAG: Ig-like domain-containing protein [Bacteroidota bacterium]
MKYIVFLLLLIISKSTIYSQALGYNNNRIAVSADGNNQPDLEYTGTYNTADPDDWGATPATLIMMAKAELQDKLVHYSYNNFMPSPPHTTEKNYMKEACDQAIERLLFNGDVFFDVGTHKEEAIESLKNELTKSTADDPLYYIHMGPSEFFYQAVKRVVDDGSKLESLSHVYIISHSGYNDNHLRRDTEHTMAETIALSGDRLKYTKIKDQNNCDVGWLLWCSGTKDHPWRDIRDHEDPHIQWLWERMNDHKHGKYDISDAGMLWYLLKGDEDGSPGKFSNFLGYGILLPGDELAKSIDISEGSVVVLHEHPYQLDFGFTPAEPWDDYYYWRTSDASVVYVSPEGRLIGVNPGTATVTVTAGIDNITDQVQVTVVDKENCNQEDFEGCSTSCELAEIDGLLVIEAERFNLKGQWQIVEGDNLASGNKYLEYTGANSYNQANTANEISYTFSINNPGTYTFKWFMRQPDEAEGDLSNDVWIKMEDGVGLSGGSPITEYAKFVGRSKGVFTMNGQLDINHQSSSFGANFPEAGEYTIKITGRSQHLQFDKIVFYKNGISGNDAVYMAASVTETTNCSQSDVSTEYRALEGINIESESIELEVNASETIEVVFTPFNATNKTLNWESSDASVATVEGNVVTAVGPGAATITVISVDGGFSKTIDVIVSRVLSVGDDALVLYPNPMRDTFKINSKSPGLLKIMALNGKTLKTRILQVGENSISVQGISSGTYFVNIKDREGVRKAKIIIE